MPMKSIWRVLRPEIDDSSDSDTRSNKSLSSVEGQHVTSNKLYVERFRETHFFLTRHYKIKSGKNNQPHHLEGDSDFDENSGMSDVKEKNAKQFASSTAGGKTIQFQLDGKILLIINQCCKPQFFSSIKHKKISFINNQ